MARNDANFVARVLDEASDEVIRRVLLRGYQGVTSGTPVDTGFARGSVEPSTGSPEDSPLERPASEGEAISEGAANLARNRARALEIARTYRKRDGRAFLVARASYFGFLNAGSSSQAPAMFVERAIDEAIRSIGDLS